jgi:ABC-type molybdate transport system substrate-binding protein
VWNPRKNPQTPNQPALINKRGECHMSKITKYISSPLPATLLALVLAGSSGSVLAGKDSYTLQGTCAFLPADRATEFHGNPDRSKLNLGMAGNQWVVFDKAMQQFNVYIGKGDGTEPAYRPNDASGFTLADLNDNANRYFVELIPPGQIRNQIKSGCMTLGNDEERNFLPLNFQVDFDVFASTNYNLMQDLANNGFIDEAVPYIKNRLDLMVAVGNPQGIGNTVHTGDSEFDPQFDIIMDLLSGDVIASSLDHINEGIHNAANTYMKAAHNWVKDHDREVTIPAGSPYVYADGTTESGTRLASEWIQSALEKVATPMAGSPGAERLISRDAGENHTSHDLVDNSCGTADNLLFCEYAVLNKASTHESRVHHVETPNGILEVEGYVPVDVGFVWITELAYQLNNGNLAVQGMVGNQDISDLGIPRPAGSDVNSDITYSLALLATSRNEKRGRQFIDFLRSSQGQTVYTDGGFTGLTMTELDAGRCYAKPVNGVSEWTPRNGDGSCKDWLKNDH